MSRQVAGRAEGDHLSALLSLGPVLSAAPNLKTALARALEHVAEAASARSAVIALREVRVSALRLVNRGRSLFTPPGDNSAVPNG